MFDSSVHTLAQTFASRTVPPAPSAERNRADLPPSVTQQLNHRLYHSPWRLVNSGVGVIIISIVAIRVLPSLLVSAWVGLTLSTYLLRFVLYRAYRRASPARQADRAWSDRYVWSLAVQGTGFGVCGFFLWITPDLALHLTIAMVVAALGAGVAAMYAADGRACIVFIATSSLPVAVAALMLGDTMNVIAFLVVIVLGINMVITGRQAHHNLVQTLMLRHEREELTQALLAEKTRTELASKAKSDFLTTMSHELRTPLNAIIGFSQVMLAGLFGPLEPARYHEYCGDIHTSANHLLSLINDILDTAKIEAGKYELTEQPVDLPDIIETAARLMRCRAAEKGIDFSLALMPVPSILADERALRQILLNLLSNAIKFTPDGGAVSVSTAYSESGAVMVEVRDTGIGIPPEDLATVFDQFSRAGNAHLSPEIGTGLGLPIVRGLMALHGGDLRIESEPGAGTTVTIEFPATRILAVAA
ncbi:MAG: HAMP domain-containing sensor histidine kinase [Aliidongia sp.]